MGGLVYPFVCFISLTTDGRKRASTNPTCCDVVILPVVTKDLRISPQFQSANFYRGASSALLHHVHHWLPLVIICYLPAYYAMNAIDTLLCDPINSGMIGWRLTVNYMDAVVAESGRNPVSNHPIQPEC